jgi:ATP-dependent DNA ligase
MTVTPDLAPMELRAVDAIPDGANWQYEPKWDGFRALIHRDGDRVAITSKNGQPLARYFPELVAAMLALDSDNFSLDGELVVSIAGALSFDALQQRIHPAASRVAMLARTMPALYLAFDLLRAANVDQITKPLAARRAGLETFARSFPPAGTARLSPATRDRAVVDDWFAHVGGALDGVVAKRLDLAYASGKRDGGVKIKRERTADCVIGGYRYASGTDDRIGSLLLGLYDDAGRLDYIGFCSSFSAGERVALLDRLAPARGGTGFTGAAPGDSPSRWSRDPERDRSYVALAPQFVLEVGFDQVTGGRIRHGTRPLRWRTDKDPRSCTHEQLVVAGTALPLLDGAIRRP